MNRSWSVAPILSLLALLTLLPGCAPSPVAEAAASRMPPQAIADVNQPPKELVQTLQHVIAAPPISLDVEQPDARTVLTGWKRYRGDFHIGRYWQDRTRYRIEVSPDWDEPLARSRLAVTAETEQRAAEGQRWDREPRVPRPQRARDMLKTILDNLPASPQAPTTKPQ
jgi:hypothetical protein